MASIGVIEVGIPLDAKQEMRRDQNGLERQLYPLSESVPLPVGQLDQAQEGIDLPSAEGATVRPLRKITQDFPRALRLVGPLPPPRRRS